MEIVDELNDSLRQPEQFSSSQWLHPHSAPDPLDFFESTFPVDDHSRVDCADDLYTSQCGDAWLADATNVPLTNGDIDTAASSTTSTPTQASSSYTPLACAST